jgi:hypothetical protein
LLQQRQALSHDRRRSPFYESPSNTGISCRASTLAPRAVSFIDEMDSSTT